VAEHLPVVLYSLIVSGLNSLCLPLCGWNGARVVRLPHKSGDSYLKKRQRDGAEVVQIKNPRWADYWQQQACAVMLIIRSSEGEIRWMDVSACLKRESADGKTVKQNSRRCRCRGRQYRCR
jgi:hypothetical protein